MKSKTAALEKFLLEKDHRVPKLNAIIQEMKERQGSGIQFIQREEEIRKCDLLRKISVMNTNTDVPSVTTLPPQTLPDT